MIVCDLCSLSMRREVITGVRYCSIYLYRIDFSNECLSTDEAECATHNAEAKRKQCHITKIEYDLKHSVHSKRKQDLL